VCVAGGDVPGDAVEARVDRWLWAIRLLKTRSDSTKLCKAGHVEVNGRPAKPASVVRPGDRVEARVHDRQRIVEVVRAIEVRVGAPIAVECYVDHSPPPPEVDPDDPFARERGAGRPTKRERRRLDRWKAGS